MYTGIKFTNNASTQLAQPLTYTSTEVIVGDNTAAIFPKLNTDDYFMLTLLDVNKHLEIVRCTSRTDSSFTVVRAQEGTTAKSFPVGSLVELRLTADSITKVSEDASVTKPHTSTDPNEYGQATAQKYSHVKLTDEFDSTSQAIDGIVCTPLALKKASDRLLGVVGTTLITSSTQYVVPETGTYTITCVGGGGYGGTGGRSWINTDGWECTGPDGLCCGNPGICCWLMSSGGGGGGGGAGQVIVKEVYLTKGTVVAITIGGAGGNTTFGTYVTGLAGGRGSNGGAPGAGAAGTSYGNTASNGGGGDYRDHGTVGFDWIKGGAGGNGAVSLEGTYGNGGKGGAGGSIYFHDATNYYTTGAAGGTNGTQGCVKITMTLGQ